ncbi:histidine--tRNA ligase [Vallitalea okinawensis]|uniref:histidine--tRNA ligase n=1 Tax=Vallitalea okinawensis TaxID=2078660 RepID=UPI000CFBFE30|nr:histidine--tRNA ligase [Vallitalea okinawensis]
MSLELKNVKGTYDYMPEDQRVRQRIIRQLQDVFEKYGYQPLETPIISYFDVLSWKYAGGSEILKEVYQLSDQGQRELGLRYDLTVPFTRVIGMNPQLRMPFKRFEIGKVYRDGPVKIGRNREFIQCDVDIVGVKSVMAEAELISMTKEIYDALDLDVYISYNNRNVLSGIIQLAGIRKEQFNDVILTIDKIEKIGEESVCNELENKGIIKEYVDRLLKYLRMDPKQLLIELKTINDDSIIEGITELKELNQYLDALDLREFVRFTPSLARGLEIYTGTVWEVFLEDGSISSSIGAGGRYDKIIGTFLDNGNEYPAVGMTFGLDVIYEALKLKNQIKKDPYIEVYVIPMGTNVECLKVVKDLRNLGLRVDIDMTGRKVKKALSYANKEQIPYVMVIGDNEIKSGKVNVKDMSTGEVQEIKLNKLEELGEYKDEKEHISIN